jgi:hypothetical protein
MKTKTNIITFDEILDKKYGKKGEAKREEWEQEFELFRLVSVCLSTYFLIKKVFLALGQKDETGLHRKGETEIHRGL